MFSLKTKFRNLGLLFLLLLGCEAYAADGTISGTIRTPASGVVISNGTLSFTLNQAGVVAGSAALSTTTVTCATSTDGSIVKLKNPTFLPSVSAAASGGSLAGTYYVKVTYYNSDGETLSTGATSVVVGGGNNAFTVTGPSSVTGATGYKVYASLTQGSEKLQATTAGFGSTTITSLLSVTSLPSSNGTICSLTFNDAIIPVTTKYRVNLVDKNNAQVPGFPFFAYLSGTLVNVSNGWPTARDLETRYFSPVISSPLSNATQSVNSPLTLNGYQLSAGSIDLSNNSSPPVTQTGHGFIYADSGGTLKACENGAACVNLLGSTQGWIDAGVNVYTTTSTDRVIVGLGSGTGDFAGAGFNGAIVGAPGFYATSALTNGSTAALTYDTGTTTAKLESGRSAAGGTYVPLSIFTSGSERARVTTGGLFLVGSSFTSSSSTGLIQAKGKITALADGTNADTISLTTSAASYVALEADKIGSSTGLPLEFRMWDNSAGATAEAARFSSGADLAGTGKIFNLNVITGGGGATTSYQYPIHARRDQNTITSIGVSNQTVGTAAVASFVAVADGGSAYFGVTSSGLTPASGVRADGAIITDNGGLSGGISIVTNGGIHLNTGTTNDNMTLTQNGGFDLKELGGAPAAPGAQTVRIYALDAAGKVRLYALFPTGAAQTLATEP